jgi:tRNA threonylcarbamoyl adenosine modification protein YeaZ
MDTATEDVATAAVELVGDTVARVERRVLRDARGAGEYLLPLAMSALAAAGAGLRDVDAFAVGVGPGPYTGLRVGVVTAAALGRALSRPVYGACSLDLFAVPDAVVVTDARRREVFWAVYGPDVVRTEGPAVSAPASLAARLGDATDPLYGRRVLGPGVARFPSILTGRVHAGPAGEDDSVPVERLATLVASRALAGAPGDSVAPTYLRRPDAAPVGTP